MAELEVPSVTSHTERGTKHEIFDKIYQSNYTQNVYWMAGGNSPAPRTQPGNFLIVIEIYKFTKHKSCTHVYAVSKFQSFLCNGLNFNDTINFVVLTCIYRGKWTIKFITAYKIYVFKVHENNVRTLPITLFFICELWTAPTTNHLLHRVSLFDF